MKGLPKYCKHLYKHNPCSSQWSYSTGNTSITTCSSCRYHKKIRSNFIKEIYQDHTNVKHLPYISSSYHKLEIWEIAGQAQPKLVIKFNEEKLNQDYPFRCPQHSSIKVNQKRRFGSGFTRRRWKEERHLNGGKHSNARW